MTTAEKTETDPAQALITCERCGHQAQYSVECDHGSTGTAAPSAASEGSRGAVIISMVFFLAVFASVVGFSLSVNAAHSAEEQREIVEEKYEQYLPERLKEEG